MDTHPTYKGAQGNGKRGQHQSCKLHKVCDREGGQRHSSLSCGRGLSLGVGAAVIAMETVMFQQVDKVGRCNVEEEMFEVEQNGKEEGSLQAAPLQLG